MANNTSGKVRLSTALSAGETQAVATRKEVVKKALEKLNITGGKVPTIAVLGSGGGLRAMIALYGTLAELKNQNLLDVTMYLAGVSGSTWCMSELYKNEDWSENIKKLENDDRKTLTHGHWDFWKARAAAIEAAEDKNYSLTDFWAYFIIYDLLKQLDESKLSEQRESSENGKNPYPIYAAVDHNRFSKHQPGSWYEFTPHEVGIAGLGASIDSKDFGSEFENGQLKVKNKEKIICYLQGLWGSALGSLEEIKKTIEDKILHLFHHEMKRDTLRKFSTGSHESRGRELPSRLNPAILLTTDEEEKRRELEKALTMMFGVTESLNVWHSFTDWIHYLRKTWKCLEHWIWGTTNNFVYHCSEVDSPELIKEPVVSLVDAGIAINTAYPLILRPEREVDLILSFDFSSGDPFETLIKTAEYCKENGKSGLRFPNINENELQNKDNPLDCYIFRGKGAATVMHFPLFNRVNCPGEIEEYRREFPTLKMSYSVEDIEKLLTAAKKNVKNVDRKIIEEIQHIVDPPSSNE